jgi:hypothetical protein
VVLDYVHPPGLRLALLGGAVAGLTFLASWSVLILVAHVNSA